MTIETYREDGKEQSYKAPVDLDVRRIHLRPEEVALGFCTVSEAVLICGGKSSRKTRPW